MHESSLPFEKFAGDCQSALGFQTIDKAYKALARSAGTDMHLNQTPVTDGHRQWMNFAVASHGHGAESY